MIRRRCLCRAFTTRPSARVTRRLRRYGRLWTTTNTSKTTDAVRLAIASYYALVSFLDDNIGKVLAALDAAGLTDSTRVIYTSDHGENLGSRGLWGKSVMYEESAAIPFIAAGPAIEAGKVVDTPISLVDCYRSVLEAVGCPDLPEEDRPSLTVRYGALHPAPGQTATCCRSIMLPPRSPEPS